MGKIHQNDLTLFQSNGGKTHIVGILNIYHRKGCSNDNAIEVPPKKRKQQISAIPEQKKVFTNFGIYINNETKYSFLNQTI